MLIIAFFLIVDYWGCSGLRVIELSSCRVNEVSKFRFFEDSVFFLGGAGFLLFLPVETTAEHLFGFAAHRDFVVVVVGDEECAAEEVDLYLGLEA